MGFYFYNNMKITHDIINKIFNNQLTLKTNEDIIQLSKLARKFSSQVIVS